MKKNATLTLLVSVILFVSCSNREGTFTDSRDGKTYKTIKIRNQIWMAENLAYNTRRSCIPYDENANNVDEYGYLYQWEVAGAACPEGWHLPSKSEIETLLSNVGEDKFSQYDALIPSGSSKFNATFGGLRERGDFGGIDEFALFWSNSEVDETTAYCLGLSRLHKHAAITDLSPKSLFLSIRCIKK